MYDVLGKTLVFMGVVLVVVGLVFLLLPKAISGGIPLDFHFRWDSLMNVRPTGRDVDIDVGTDTVVIRWNGNRVVLMDDLLIAYRGKGVNLRMEDYSYEPVLHPRRLIVRSMGASIIMMVDSIKPLP